MPRVIEVVAKAAKVTARQIQHSHGGRLRMLCAWLGRYEGWQRLTMIAASLRLESSGRISDLIAECEARLGFDAPLREMYDLVMPALRA